MFEHDLAREVLVPDVILHIEAAAEAASVRARRAARASRPSASECSPVSTGCAATRGRTAAARNVVPPLFVNAVDAVRSPPLGRPPHAPSESMTDKEMAR